MIRRSGLVEPGDDTGSVTVLMLFLTVSMLVVAGIVFDGGRAMAARQRTANSAEQAARAGADALSMRELRSGRTVVAPAAARTAAVEYLRATGLTGTVSVSGNTVTVTARSRMQTSLLGLIGINTYTQRAQASARAARGVVSEGR